MPTTLSDSEVLEKAQAIRDADNGPPTRKAAADFVSVVGGSYSLTSFNSAAEILREKGFGEEAALVELMSLDHD